MSESETESRWSSSRTSTISRPDGEDVAENRLAGDGRGDASNPVTFCPATRSAIPVGVSLSTPGMADSTCSLLKTFQVRGTL